MPDKRTFQPGETVDTGDLWRVRLVSDLIAEPRPRWLLRLGTVYQEPKDVVGLVVPIDYGDEQQGFTVGVQLETWWVRRVGAFPGQARRSGPGAAASSARIGRVKTRARRRMARPRRRTPVALVLVAVVAAAAIWMLWTRGSPRPPATPAAAPAATAPVADTPAAPPTPAAFARLVGDWVRPDGGYVLAVSGVARDGTAAVAYYNPRFIRVARAVARQDEERVSLFVEFDDVNYPGSTYALAYDPSKDELQGTYYQAVQRANYDVVFVRQR